jgi:hypothetical protein
MRGIRAEARRGVTEPEHTCSIGCTNPMHRMAARSVVFWLASRTAPNAFPRPLTVAVACVRRLLAYSGGPAPVSHRLPVQPNIRQGLGWTPERGLVDETVYGKRSWNQAREVTARPCV